jgi:hypothetical protein
MVRPYRDWHIATFGGTAKIGRYRAKADIKKVLPKETRAQDCVNHRMPLLKIPTREAPAPIAVRSDPISIELQ